MRRDLVTERVRIRLRVSDALEMYSSIELVTLASLNEKHLGFSGQGWTAFRVEVGPENIKI